jgi:hypothetical protein
MRTENVRLCLLLHVSLRSSLSLSPLSCIDIHRSRFVRYSQEEYVAPDLLPLRESTVHIAFFFFYSRESCFDPHSPSCLCHNRSSRCVVGAARI